MFYFFSQLVFWHWFALAILLAICDVLLGANFLFIWCGSAAALVGLMMLLLPLTWEFQFLIFGLGVLGSFIFWGKYLKNHGSSDEPTLNRRANQYIGRIFTLEEAIINHRGKIKVDDSLWRVEGEDLPVGSKVKVINVDGVILKVEKVSKKASEK